jgi:hypothetical protein
MLDAECVALGVVEVEDVAETTNYSLRVLMFK